MFLLLSAITLLGLASCSDNALSPGQPGGDPAAVQLPKLLRMDVSHDYRDNKNPNGTKYSTSLAWSGDTLKSIGNLGYVYKTENGKTYLEQITGIYFGFSNPNAMGLPTLHSGTPLEYDQKGRILLTGEGMYIHYRYEYEGNNLKRIYLRYSGRENVVFTALEYDNKISFYRSFPVATLQKMIHRATSYDWIRTEWTVNLPPAIFSQNNVTRFTLHDEDTGGVESEVTATYSYNSQGLPVSIRQVHKFLGNNDDGPQTRNIETTLTYKDGN